MIDVTPSMAESANDIKGVAQPMVPPSDSTPEKGLEKSAVSGARRADLTRAIVRSLAYVVLFVAWYLLAVYVVGTAILPTPFRVWERLAGIFAQGMFWPNFVATMLTFLQSFVIGFGAGVVIGVLMGRTRYFEAFFRDGITVIMGLPGVVIIIVCLMIWALSPWGRVTAVALGLIPLVAINVAEGARAVPRDLLDMAASYGVTRRRLVRDVVFPATAPYVFTGARLGLAVGFKSAAMIEVFGGSSGMGFQLRTEFTRYSIAGVMAWTVLILAIVMVLEIGILKTAERRIFRWRQAAFG